MKHSSVLRRRALLRAGLFLTLPLLAGCSSFFEAQPDRTRFYLLSARSSLAVHAVDNPSGLTIGLCRIELPAYLRSPAVVLRPGGTEVTHVADARWAEPLEQGIARVLRETLQAQPAVRSVLVYPAPQAPLPAYEIAVRVAACEGAAGGGGVQVRFAATWEIRSTAAAPGAPAVAAGTFEPAPETVGAADPAALTAKLGEAVAALARELAVALPK